MKAILLTQYGSPDGLQLAEVEKPAPTDRQLLVKVRAASLNALEWRRFTGPRLLQRLMGGGLTKPRNPRLGVDVAGVVEAVGSQVAEFVPGHEVFGVAPGALAEYACNGASKFARKPAHVSFEAAAAVPVAAFTALQGLRDKGHLQAGQTALIYGASGGVGTFAVQIAKAHGAQVTAVCSARNVDLIRSLGADHVLDYAREDFAAGGRQYDLILAVNGSRPLGHYRRALSPKGKCVVAGGSLSQVFQAMLLGPILSRAGLATISFMGIATTPQQDLLVLKDLLEARKLVPVIDRCYPLSRTAEAIRYLIDEHARGKVVITVDDRSPASPKAGSA
jgi:NADPH:quinone reductase-like Zn-dependent oxidoreductase